MTINCPVCKSVPLTPTTAAPNLETSDCGNCGGRWISMNWYSAWRETHSGDIPERDISDLEFMQESIVDSRAKLCTECGGLLMPYKVGRNIAFHIDRCGHCGGMWFDRNEWEILASRNLHDNIHQIFTDAWQKSVARAELAQLHIQNLKIRFGPEDYARISEIKVWLDDHPQRSALLAYLTEPNNQ